MKIYGVQVPGSTQVPRCPGTVRHFGVGTIRNKLESWCGLVSFSSSFCFSVCLPVYLSMFYFVRFSVFLFCYPVRLSVSLPLCFCFVFRFVSWLVFMFFLFFFPVFVFRGVFRSRRKSFASSKLLYMIPKTWRRKLPRNVPLKMYHQNVPHKIVL